jgi:isopenicillin-N epimerase
MDRRRFLKLGGAGIGAGVLGAASSCTPGPDPAISVTADSPAAVDPGDWAAVRASFELDPRYIHLSGLYLSSHPAPVRAAVERHRRGLDENPVHYMDLHRFANERRVRGVAAEYLGAEPGEVALTESTTMGLATLYNGLRLGDGDEILTTTHDHYSTHESLRYRAARSGVTVRSVALYDDPARAGAEEIVARLVRALTPRTRAVALTWVHSSTGVKLPVRAIADALATRGTGRPLLCVDGVHALGVEAEGVRELGCDFLAAGTHKWMFAPRGSGVLYGRAEVQEMVTPTIPSFSWGSTWGEHMTPGGFQAFEHRWAVAEAFEFHRAIGKGRVTARIHALNAQAREGLASMRGVRLHTPRAPELAAGIICFDVEGMAPREVVRRLGGRGVIATVTPYDVQYARITPGLVNDETEIERALAEIRALAG